MAELRSWQTFSDVTDRQITGVTPQSAETHEIEAWQTFATKTAPVEIPNSGPSGAHQELQAWQSFNVTIEAAENVVTDDIARIGRRSTPNQMKPVILAPTSSVPRKAPTKTQKPLWRYIIGTMPDAAKFMSRNPILAFADAFFRGIGQVFFMNNPITGLFFIIGMLVGSRYTCLLALLGTFSGTLIARLFELDYNSTQSGLFGYNACLVAAAFATFHFGGDSAWLALPQVIVPCVVFSAISTIITVAVGSVLVGHLRLTPLTFPFQLATWMWLLGAGNAYGYFPINGGVLSSPTLSAFSSAPPFLFPLSYDVSQLIQSVFRGISQVFFISDTAAGVVMLAGVAVCSPISALFTLASSTVGMFVALGLGVAPQPIYDGLWSYNAVLAGIAMGGMFYVLSGVKVYFFALLCVVLATCMTGTISGMLRPLGMPPLTFPFVVATWLFLLTAGSMPGVVPIELAALTVPEDHLNRYRLSMLVVSRFQVIRQLAQQLAISKPDDIRRVEQTLLPLLLCAYAASGNKAELDRYFNAGADVNAVDFEKRTALHVAAAEGQTDAMMMLLRAGANVNAADKRGFTPLADAVRSRQDKAIELLKEWGGTLKVDKERCAVEMNSRAFNGDAHLLRLVDNGYPVTAGDYDGRTALHLIACGGFVSLAAQLIERGAQVNPVDRFGGTPLRDAIRYHHNEMVELLQQHGGVVFESAPKPPTAQDDWSSTLTGRNSIAPSRNSIAHADSPVLPRFSMASDIELAAAAIAAKVTAVVGFETPPPPQQPQPPSDTQQIPRVDIDMLMAQAAADELPKPTTTTRTLPPVLPPRLKRTISVPKHPVANLVGELAGAFTATVRVTTAATGTEDAAARLLLPAIVCSAAETGNLQQLMALLQDNPAAVNTHDYDLRTPLHMACESGHTDCVELLLSRGAHPSAVDRWGSTPLWEALIGNHASIASLLRAYRAKLHCNAIDLAVHLCTLASHNDAAQLRLFLLNGAPANAADYDGRTPLHLAAASGSREAIDVLRECGASVEQADRWGFVAADDAYQQGFAHLTALLLPQQQQPQQSVTRTPTRAASVMM